MRAIRKPVYDPALVYRTCVGSISNQDQQARLAAIEATLITECADYDVKATIAELFTIAANGQRNEEVVRGAVTKDELKNVYTSHMVARSKRARDIYQALLDSAPLGLCPMCGFGHAETLDHYLNKAGFPQFSVLPVNLVPACKSCNHVKLATTATTAGQQPLHPYYDNGHYISDQWLYAEVRESTPVSVRYFVSPPPHWDAVSAQRIASHFSSFQLSRRFGVQATGELATIGNMLSLYCPTEDSRTARLAEYAYVQRCQYANCWKTALYHALANSAWYCRQGFLTR